MATQTERTRNIHGDRGSGPIEAVALIAFIALVTLLMANLILDAATIDLDDPFERVSSEM